MWVLLYGIREQVGVGKWASSLEDAVLEVRTASNNPLAHGLVCDNILSKGFAVRKET